MAVAHGAAGSILPEVQVLQQSQQWLEEYHPGDNNEADDLMVPVNLVEFICQLYAQAKADQHQDDAHHLERTVNVSDLLAVTQVDGQRGQGEQEHKRQRHNGRVSNSGGFVRVGADAVAGAGRGRVAADQGIRDTPRGGWAGAAGGRCGSP